VRPTIYLETSVISYLAARRSSNARVATHQDVTHEWWETRRDRFELYVSAVVVGEAERGDPVVAAARMALVKDLRLAQVSREALDLAAALVAGAGVPKKANEDAVHIATAAVNGIDYLLTWNCTHIANAVTIPLVNTIYRRHGFEAPLIYTPFELMEG
jgi:predicted nucleic acid-binding protein